MAKRHFETTDDTERLVTYYLSHIDNDFDKLANKALREFIANTLNDKQLRHARQTKLDETYPIDAIKSFGSYIEE